MAKAKNIVKRLRAVAFALTLAAAGCSGSSEQSNNDVGEPANTVVPKQANNVVVDTAAEQSSLITLDYLPDEDGFQFANYGGGAAPASLTVNLARRLYGDEQACASVDDSGKCVPHPVMLQLIDQANRAMAGGLCEGFAVLSLRLQNDGQYVYGYEQADPAVAAELAFWFVTQFASETQAAAAFYREQSPSQIVQTLAKDFANPAATAGYTLGLYSAEGGHAVTPYAVEATSDGARIYIYDSNWPGEERWIDVVGNQWSYALAATNPQEESSAWSGTTGTLELTPMASRQPPFSCSFCPREDGTKSMTLLTAASSSESQVALQVVDSEGNRLGVFDGELVNEIPGAVYRYISTSNTSDPVLVMLPGDLEDWTADVATVDGSDDGRVSLFVAQDGAGARVETTVADVTDENDDEPVLAVSQDTGYEINDLDQAEVAIADENIALTVEIQDNQELAFQFVAPEPPAPIDDTDSDSDEPDPEPVAVPQLVIAIATDEGEEVVEVEISTEANEGPQEITVEVNEAGEVEIEEEELEAAPLTVAEEFQAMIEDDQEIDDGWNVDVEWIEDIDEEAWEDLDQWEEDLEEEPAWVWDDGEDFVEWVEEELDGELEWIETVVDEEFIAEMEEVIAFTVETFEDIDPEEWDEEWSWEPEEFEDEEFWDLDELPDLDDIELPDPWELEEEFIIDEEIEEFQFETDLEDDWEDDWRWETITSMPEFPQDDEDLWEDMEPIEVAWPDDEESESEPDLLAPIPELESDDEDEEPDTETPLEEGTEQEESPDELDSLADLLDPESPLEEQVPEEPVIEEPPPQPSWDGGSSSVWEELADETSTETDTNTSVSVTSMLYHNDTDGHWYQQVTTATTVTETETVSTISSQRLRTDDWWCYDDGTGQGGCGGGTTYGDTVSTTTVADPTVVSTQTTSTQEWIPASCDQGGWTGFGDWCIVSTPQNRNQREVVQFTVPDDTDLTGETRHIVIRAETNLRRQDFNQTSQFGDPYIYLYEDDDPDAGAHTGDTTEYTRGTFIESDDDGGRDCGTATGTTYADCINPPAGATDPDEFVSLFDKHLYTL